MIPIYSGFDGLEFAVKATIPIALDKLLASAKEQTQLTHSPCAIELSKAWLTVREVGARGGYAYSCSEESTGNWFFKRPSKGDPWGIRFSASSSSLVLLGFDGLRQRAAELLANLGIDVPISAYSPSRVDFAVDFLAPDFEVCPNQFVIHSHTSRKSIDLIESIETNGHSGRTTSVTVGKMPGRQAIIYDKREEVMVKRKVEWPLIWARSLNGFGAEPLDLSDRASSQIWRVEIRVAKRHLKDVWDINSWASLYEMLPRVFEQMLTDIRYCVATSDGNRSRWETHEIWQAVQHRVKDDLFGHVPKLDAEEYLEIKRSQKVDELCTQILGLIISWAAIEGAKSEDFSDFLDALPKYLAGKACTSRRLLADRLATARDKYRHLV